MLVIDASAVIDLLLNGNNTPSIETAVAGETLVAPELIDVEVTSALARLERSGVLVGDQAEAALSRYESFPLDRVSHQAVMMPAWKLRSSLRIADAYYAALAQQLDAALLTTDARLIRSGQVKCVALRS